MVDELNELARWTTYLIRANCDFREHACEFSKFLVQNVPDDDWPDVAEQLIRLLDDVESMSRVCVPLARSFSGHLAKSVASLNLPKPAEHLSWTLWIVEHWMHVEGLLKLHLGSMVSVPPTNPEYWFHQLAIQARFEPHKCRNISRLL